MSLELVLSPMGHLFIELSAESEPKLAEAAVSRLSDAFAASSVRGLESLASEFLYSSLPVSLVFWRDLARKYFTNLCHNPNAYAGEHLIVGKPTGEEFEAMALGAPPMKGLEYLDSAVLERLWDELDAWAREAIGKTQGGVQAYLQARNPLWNAVGRVTFHLAENKRNPDQPFAFLATYTHRVSDQGKVQHIPLGRALEEYAGTRNRAALTTLLSPVQRASEKSKLARELLDSRAVFHPQAWQPAQAYRFLKEIPLLEESGVVVHIPDWWKAGRPPRPQVSVRIGEKRGGIMNKDGLLDFNIEMSLDGQPLTEEEWNIILNSTSGLALLKGKWVEVDRDKLKEVLDHWKKVQAETGSDGVSLLQGLRLLSGFDPSQSTHPAEEEAIVQWSGVAAGKWLKNALNEIQNPEASAESDPGPELHAQLRPYQRLGVHWLWFMTRLGLGACLADDMGLGKTIQVISLLLALKRRSQSPELDRPSLLIVPASLIANWRSEIKKFAPSLSVFYAHPAETPAEFMNAVSANPSAKLAGRDLVISSYALVARQPWFKEMDWNLVILDEAQAIKNPGARQTRVAKEMKARCRIAMSGTPIENRLTDLWSLFDFICPGLLGRAAEFGAFVNQQKEGGQQQFAALRRLVRPYILRRLKTDKRIIDDLPDKTELNSFCSLSRAQAVLYQESVRELAAKLEAPEVEGIQRRGVILAFLTRFKQICNHPSQWLGDGAYKPSDSGKFNRLAELCEEIASKQEKVLIFTQYREMTEPLARYLSGVFGKSGLVLSGETAIKKRKELVDSFQADGGPPFFVLSLKAGGTGLNLTAASHVIHFDRWWNPAVENQATDRAFRIGQKRAVMVHKFICRGTMEERIHELISDKIQLADDILGEGAERLMTEMSNSDLLRFVALDIKAATLDE